jgi:hypothetical protein
MKRFYFAGASEQGRRCREHRIDSANRERNDVPCPGLSYVPVGDPPSRRDDAPGPVVSDDGRASFAIWPVESAGCETSW